MTVNQFLPGILTASALNNAFNNLPLSVKQFGAKGDGSTDDTAALNAAAAAVKALGSRTLYMPAGVYLCSAKVIFDDIQVVGDGVDWPNNATVIRATAGGILLLETRNNASLEGLVVDGNNLATWALMVTGGRTFTRMEVINATEYGVVCNAAQNCAFYSVTARQSAIQWVFANGTRNVTLTNCHSSVQNGPNGSGATAAQRLMLLLIDTSNPHGFGLSTSVVGGGNDRISFLGGVHETFNSVSAYSIETRNNSGYGGNTAGDIMFFGTEFDSGQQILLTESTFTGIMHLYNPYWGWKDDNTAASSGTAGTLLFYADNNFNLNGGGNLAQRGITQRTNLYKKSHVRTSEWVAPSNTWDYGLSGGGGTVTWNATTKTFSVSAGSSVQGLQLPLRGLGRNTSVDGATIVAMKSLIKITANIANIVGGGGQISVYADLSVSPFRVLIGNIGAGANTLYYKCMNGNESGSVSFTLNGCTSFDVSNVEVDTQ